MSDTNGKNRILVIAGPTAVGKTAFACHAADRFAGEIISCDSMQIYRGMDIGTAKPTGEELTLHPHHLIDIVDPADDFSASKYAQMARETIDEVTKRGRLPIVCGGTGLYLDGILYEMDYGKGPDDPDYRRDLEAKATEDPQALHEELKVLDPEAAEAIHPNNTKRLIRALERIHLGEGTLRPFGSERTPNPGIDPLLIGLSRPREELYDRINRRVDIMMEEGLLDEVKRLRSGGLGPENTSMLGIGYKELLEYLEDEEAREGKLEAAVERIRTGTRHYAKRQFTWFKRYDKMNWLDISAYQSEDAAMEAMDRLISHWLQQ